MFATGMLDRVAQSAEEKPDGDISDGDNSEFDAALLDALLGGLMAHGMEGESATGSVLCDGALCDEFKEAETHRARVCTNGVRPTRRRHLRIRHPEATTLLDAIQREVEALNA